MTSPKNDVVDADGHVLEPADTWQQYIDPAFRDRAIRIGRDDEGLERVWFDNAPMQLLRGNLGTLGGIELEPGQLGALTREYTYADGSPPGSYDPAERLKVLDSEGIDRVLLYPTIGICWEGNVDDPDLASAYTRAYNRWLVDFCSHAPNRLYPVAHISLIDPEGAVDEAIRARKAGCVGVYLSPDAPARNGRRLSDPVYDRFWSTVQDLDMPVGFHVVVREQNAFHHMPEPNVGAALFFFAFLAIDVMSAFTAMVCAGMFERYPRLKCSVLEAGGNWISAWLDRLDHKYEVMSRAGAVSAETERVLLPAMPDLDGPGRRHDHRSGTPHRRGQCDLGVGLSPHRCLLRGGEGDEGRYRLAAHRGAAKGARART